MRWNKFTLKTRTEVGNNMEIIRREGHRSGYDYQLRKDEKMKPFDVSTYLDKLQEIL